jgi:hypothetical protein
MEAKANHMEKYIVKVNIKHLIIIKKTNAKINKNSDYENIKNKVMKK